MAEDADFLYPFLRYDDSRDPTALLEDLAASAVGKAEASRELVAATMAAMGDRLGAAAAAITARFEAGGRLLTFGNGGSSTDAAGLAELFTRPPWGQPRPARCLVEDQAVLTALGNDVGFDLVFGRQIIAHAAEADIAVGLSTSGNSRNLLVAFEEAASRGLLTIGLAGYDGGDMARSPHVQHCLVVAADSIHRVQEVQAALGFALWASVQEHGRVPLGARDEEQSGRESRVLDRIEAFRRRQPRLTDEVVTSAHGAGGKASAALVHQVFLKRFGGDDPGPANDAAICVLPSGERVAFCTDSHVVHPRRFPGGSIGHLAVHGTVNDLAVQGARPAWLSAAFVIEEGFPIADLEELADDMADAAAAAGVAIVTGDTKVVGRGAADGVYITTAGVGLVPAGRHLGPELVQPGDRVLVSGTIGDHGMAVVLARGDLALDADIRSDTASVAGLVEDLLAAAPGTRWLRDPTRGGVATVCNELAHDTGLAVVLDEPAVPVLPIVTGACDLLGIDPLYVANEGKVVAIVAPEDAEAALAAMRAHTLGVDAAIIGEVAAEPEGIVVLRTTFGSTRIVDMLVGDPLPRIC